MSSNISFCTDLIFMPKLNVVTHSSVHSSFHKTCYQQITSAKFDLCNEDQPLYKGLV